MPTELRLRRTESEGGEGVVPEERVSNFGDLLWEWIQWSLIWTRQRHRQAAAAQTRRSSSACLASMTRGEATEEATTKGRIVVVTVAAQARRSLSACLTLTTRRGGGATGVLSRWQSGSGGGAGLAFVVVLLGVEVEDKRGSWLATGGNRRAQPAHTPGRCAVEIGALVLVTDEQGHPEW